MLPKITSPQSWQKWAVIACDQFTSEPEYWSSAEKLIGNDPSALDLILPEAYLEDHGDTDAAIDKINAKMREYKSSVLELIPDTIVYVERTQSDGKIRRGIVGKLDLEQYDYTKGATLPVRATEGTVLDRIPPRVKIRRGAELELPHIMLLIDDPTKDIIESLSAQKQNFPCLYDFDLMLGGGHIAGYRLTGADKESLLKKLDALSATDEQSPLVFAAGDGNHSLASAKALYEEIKLTLTPEEAAVHPARYALAEVVNLHDDALEFEPIYRVLFNCDSDDVLAKLREYVGENTAHQSEQSAEFITSTASGTINFTKTSHTLTVGTLQNFIDGYIKASPQVKCDYIHGEGSVKTLTKSPNTIGFTFTGMQKSQLFTSVKADGTLPRKTFSMGEAKDKRYYIEARGIR